MNPLAPMPMSPDEIADLIERARAAGVALQRETLRKANAAQRRPRRSTPTRIGARLVALTGCSYADAAWSVRDFLRCTVSPRGIADAYVRIYGKGRAPAGVRRSAPPTFHIPF